MKRGKAFVGTVALAASFALSWLIVPSAGAGGGGIPAVLRLLEEIRANLDACLPQLEVLAAPDLVPLPLPGVGFCRIAEGKLHLRVYNQGGAPAGPSQTLVVFRTASGGQNLFVDTIQLDRLSGTDLVMDIPEGCFGNVFGPDDNNVCKFEILVDALIGSPVGAVLESNELNNTAAVACQGLL